MIMKFNFTPLMAFFCLWIATQPYLASQNDIGLHQPLPVPDLVVYQKLKKSMSEVFNPESKSQEFQNYDCSPENIIPETGWSFVNNPPSDFFGMNNHTQVLNASPEGCTNTIWTGGFLQTSDGTTISNQHLSTRTIQIPLDVTDLCFEFASFTGINSESQNSYSFIRINGVEVFTKSHLIAENTLNENNNIIFVYQCVDIIPFAGMEVTIEIGNTTPEASNLNGNVFLVVWLFVLHQNLSLTFLRAGQQEISIVRMVRI
jgi:hypothetical protein